MRELYARGRERVCSFCGELITGVPVHIKTQRKGDLYLCQTCGFWNTKKKEQAETSDRE